METELASVASPVAPVVPAAVPVDANEKYRAMVGKTFSGEGGIVRVIEFSGKFAWGDVLAPAVKIVVQDGTDLPKWVRCPVADAFVAV